MSMEEQGWPYFLSVAERGLYRGYGEHTPDRVTANACARDASFRRGLTSIHQGDRVSQ